MPQPLPIRATASPPPLVRRRLPTVVCGLASTLALATALAAAPGVGAGVPVSRFDVDAEGWTAYDLLPPPGSGGAPVTHVSPPGLISVDDIYAWTVFSAPSAFLGDKSAYAGGTLAFELSDTLTDPLSPRFPTLVLRSGLNYLAWLGGVPGTDLTPFVATLAPSAQWLFGATPTTATPATAADFAQVLGALDGLYINADWATAAVDTSRLDNVALAEAAPAAVPEPGSAALCAAGFIAAAALARRRRGAAPSE